MALEKYWKWLVLVSAYTGIIILCTTIYMGGILYVALLEKYPGNVAKASLILALNNALLGLLGPVVTTITNRFSCRFAMMTGGVLLTLSGVLSAFASSLDMLLFTYGILGGIGNGMVGTPFSVVLGFYFDKRRDFVIALSMSVIAVGMLIAAPLVTFLLETYALSGTFFIIAALNAQLCIIGAICKPSRLEKLIHNKRKRHNTESEKDQSTGKRRVNNTIVTSIQHTFSKLKHGLITDVTFMLFLGSILALYVLLSVVALHIPNYAAVTGSSSFQIAVITTCFNAGNAAGRFLASVMVATGKIDNMWSHTVQVGIIGVLALTLPYYDAFFLAKYMFAVLVGLFTGAPCALMTPISLELVGVENIASAHGLEYLFGGGGQLVGPPIAAALYGYTGSYKYSFIFAGCVGLAGSLMTLASKRRFISRREQENDSTIEKVQFIPIKKEELRRE